MPAVTAVPAIATVVRVGIIVAIPGVIIPVPGIIPPVKSIAPIGVVPPQVVVPAAGIPGQAALILEPVAGAEVAVIVGAVEVVAEVELKGILITVVVAAPILVGVIPVLGCHRRLRWSGHSLGFNGWLTLEGRFPISNSEGYTLGGVGPVVAGKIGIIPVCGIGDTPGQPEPAHEQERQSKRYISSHKPPPWEM